MGANAAFHGTGTPCQKCHTMHASEDAQLPIMPGDGGPAEGPNANLLYKANSTELCLVCHDGQAGTPDVFEDDVNDPVPDTERAAGRFTGGIGVDNLNGHNLGQPLDSGAALCDACHFGGSFNTASVGCVNCHSPHGADIDYSYSNGYRYRNLVWASDPDNTPTIKAFAVEGVSAVVSHTNPALDVYVRENIAYPAPDTQASTWREVSNMCVDCHHTLSGDEYTRDINSNCIRHPNADSERNAWAAISDGIGSTDPTHWSIGTGYGFDITIGRLPFLVPGALDFLEANTVVEIPSGGEKTIEVFCLTCHKAHGSQYDYSMRWDYKNAGDDRGCQQCHNTPG